MKKYIQKDAYTSPWGWRDLVWKALFNLVWLLLCRWTPKPFFRMRNHVLKAFGADITGAPFVDSSARIHFPWTLSLGDHSCIARRVDVYSLDRIVIGARAVVAQDVMLCCGTHDFASERLELMTAPIEIGAGAFVGARAILLPGARVAEGAIVGAGAVLSGDTAPGRIYAGNPAREIGLRSAPPMDAALVEIAR